MVADSDMRGAPGEVGSRQSSPYRGSAPIHRRHAATRDTRLPAMFDTPQIALTPWHCSAIEQARPLTHHPVTTCRLVVRGTGRLWPVPAWTARESRQVT